MGLSKYVLQNHFIQSNKVTENKATENKETLININILHAKNTTFHSKSNYKTNQVYMFSPRKKLLENKEKQLRILPKNKQRLYKL